MTIETYIDGFQLAGKPFFPCITADNNLLDDPKFNCASIYLNGSLRSDLTWNGIEELADKIIANGKYILWDLNLGIQNSGFRFSDPLQYKSLSLSIKTFLSRYYEKYQKHTLGINLYRGSLTFPGFTWNAMHRDHFRLYKNNDLHQQRNYMSQVTAEYLLQLCALLPEDLIPFAFFDAKEIENSSHILELLSRERYSHIQFGVYQMPVDHASIELESGRSYSGYLGKSSRVLQEEKRVGFCFPKSEFLDEKMHITIDQILTSLRSTKVPVRIIEENLLFESWDNLSHIIIVKGNVSSRGIRMLQGFKAAGGQVLEYEKLSEELLSSWLQINTST